MLDVLFFILYRWILIPISLVFLKISKPFLPEKLQRLLNERSSPQKPAIWARPIWIHAASGELEYAKPVLRELKAKYPQIPLLVTYFSPSAHRLAKGVSEIDFFLPLPFDHHRLVRRFIASINPLAVFFARTDVWPELALQLRQKGIPTLLFSATLAENSSRVRGFGKFFSRFALNQLDEIFCVNEEDQRLFKKLGVSTPVQVKGDSRFDQVLFRLMHPKDVHDSLQPQSKKVFVAGSTWPADEKILMPAFNTFAKNSIFVILAPHEVQEHRLLDIENQLKAQGLKSVRYSNASSIDEMQVLIIDQIGILPEVYTWGQVAFVGGSFKDRVHSVMEPLAAGLPVIVGPHHQNNREALHFANLFLDTELMMVTVVSDSESLAFKALKLFKLSENPETAKNIKLAIEKSSGASKQIADWPSLKRLF